MGSTFASSSGSVHPSGGGGVTSRCQPECTQRCSLVPTVGPVLLLQRVPTCGTRGHSHRAMRLRVT
jgi:hypothetical protein